ncbi:unnamed protein product [Xylocopa violacea]|uniref:ATP-dependent DNA helicase 2 subunit 1 n=2 Tax=Xylocopa violacea TaxID=135666 RepID=A0ABP1NJ56_XYLVO
MASPSEEDLETEEDIEDDLNEHYGVTDGTLFIIDATSQMFESDSDEKTPYFLQSIRQCIEILKQKSVWNRQDWIGLILFGTEKCDPDLEMKHILTLQKLQLVSMEGLKQVMKIDQGEWKYYRDIASSVAYPLHDVLWYAARTFSAKRITMPIKRVILFTCQDNPSIIDNDEKHRIRAQVASYNDLELQLFVIGLGKNWNHDLFYKDLEMLSRKVEMDDYKRTSLNDLMEQVKLPSRNMAQLIWRIGENVNVDVSLRNLCVKTQYLKKENISKETNTPLTTCSYAQVKADDIEEIENEENDEASPILESDIQKYQTFAGRDIYFKPAEVKSLSVIQEPGIDIICIKPISYHLLYHCETPYFVTPGKSTRKDNQLLFGALLNKCDSRNLMIICVVTIRKHSVSNLYTMIPNAKNGGFYLYKIPFIENVRKLNEYFSDYLYDNNERKAPIDPEGVKLLEKMIKKLNFEYSPILFSNPTLQVQLEFLETLALDLEQRKPPPDDTLPKIDEMRKLVKNLLNEYDEIFNDETGPPKKKIKQVNQPIESDALENEEKIQELVTNGKIETLTTSQLRTILKTLSLKTSGKKDELINKIKEHFK